jgi:hypothetical protein
MTLYLSQSSQSHGVLSLESLMKTIRLKASFSVPSVNSSEALHHIGCRAKRAR